MVFISHDLAVVEYLSNRIAVMYLGRIVELGPASAVFRRAEHPYTQALIRAIPAPDPTRKSGGEAVSGDSAERGQPAVGLRIPNPLPQGPGNLRHPAADRSAGRRTLGGLSFCWKYGRRKSYRRKSYRRKSSRLGPRRTDDS